jgi:hypothetical protein
MSWTLARTNSVDERTLLEWGIKSGSLVANNEGGEEMQLGFAFTDLLASLPFDDDETLLISRDGAPFFRARNVGDSRGAFGSSEGITLNLAGPWWYLENTVYQQFAGFVLDPNANPDPENPAGLQIEDFEVVSRYTSLVVLGEDASHNRIDTHDQIVAILEYAISLGAPFVIGTIDPALAGPRQQFRDASCADLILSLLKMAPGHSIFWDHSGELPAINIRARANRAPVTIDLADKAVAQVTLNPRRDLKVSGVTINFLRIHRRPGFQFLTLDKEQAGPDPEGIAALILTLGVNGSYIIENEDFDLVPQETAPIGIAAALYAEYSIVPYAGRVVLVEQELTPWLSHRLNVASGFPPWADAAAVVQQMQTDLFPLANADGEWFRVELTVGPPKLFKPGLRLTGSSSGVPSNNNVPTSPPVPGSFPPTTPPTPPAPHTDYDPAGWASGRVGHTGAYGRYRRDDNCGGVGHTACPGLEDDTIPYGPEPDYTGVVVPESVFGASIAFSKQRLFGPPSEAGYASHIKEVQAASGGFSEWIFDFTALNSGNCVRLKLIGTKTLSKTDGSTETSAAEVDLTASIGATLTLRASPTVGAVHFNSGTTNWDKSGSVTYPILRVFRPAGWTL